MPRPRSGPSFATALAAKDFDRIGELLHPQVDFRGLTPSRDWEASDAETVIGEVLRLWFEDSDEIEELLQLETDAFADRERVGYRFRVRNPDGLFEVEQQVYVGERDGRIGWMRSVCSGFRPVEARVSAEVAAANQESTDAWSGPLFERFVRFRGPMTAGSAPTARSRSPPIRRVPATASSTSAAASATRRGGSPSWSATARWSASTSPRPSSSWPARRPRRRASTTPSFRLGDVQIADLGGPYDYVFSRMGVMFFANPVAALRNVRAAMAPGARACAVVWRRKLDDGWVWEAEQVVEEYLEHPEESDEPTCGPGPFSMANADTVSEQLAIAGFESIELRRSDLPMRMGDDARRRGRPDDVDRPGWRGAPPLGRPRRRDPAADRRRPPRGAGALRDRRRRPCPVVDLGGLGARALGPLRGELVGGAEPVGEGADRVELARVLGAADDAVGRSSRSRRGRSSSRRSCPAAITTRSAAISSTVSSSSSISTPSGVMRR